ncbi:peptide/nickel transport system ATP-binding protein [Sporobacter termitidis DSM 10068]|uniref:Peptide/nickel transport system ATP-binding protein n=1 Tax=Sporobacter termitidis DSM 10068 TaxID=1123282 RepID=A0A1M5XWC7_9FIRM|nr:ABC transporter ATP-binding protein [Sporobacter termitidis]SHI04131.1 peptide/nickel transport system ATP-binding protein [Sporobacter termitidis DSM 10068]
MSNSIDYTGREPLVEARHLKKYFKLPRKGVLHAVDDLSFNVYPGETLGLVGESGCGKSTVGNVMMRLLPKTDGQLLYRGKDVFTEWPDKLEISKKMQIIFQDPYSSLNPRKTVDKILSEPYFIHKYGGGDAIAKAVRELCDRVELPHNILSRFPHELDGGMRQVVGIARALSLDSDLIICDEPVSSLDVSVQARIINLLMDLQKRLNLSYLFISHDLSVVRHISNRIAIMYLGQIVEMADTDEIFTNAMHPYSIALLSAVPRVNTGSKVARIVLKGDVPSPVNPKPGCRFAPRCWMSRPACAAENQELVETAPGHFVFCRFAAEARERAKAAQTYSLD